MFLVTSFQHKLMAYGRNGEYERGFTVEEGIVVTHVGGAFDEGIFWREKRKCFGNGVYIIG